jgi:hypothetical protein
VFARAQVVKYNPNSGRTLVHYCGFKSSQDEWVTADRLSRKMPSPSRANRIAKQGAAKHAAAKPIAAMAAIVVAPKVPLPALAADPVHATDQVYLVVDRGALFRARLLHRRNSGGRTKFCAKFEGWGSRYNKWVVAQQVCSKTNIDRIVPVECLSQ